MNKAQTLKILRTAHGWLGFLLLPWIIVIGSTGFYLNHSRMVLNWIEPAPFEEAAFVSSAGAGRIDLPYAASIAQRTWPEFNVPDPDLVTYHGFVAFKFERGRDQVIVARDTGHYYVKSRFVRSTFAPDGTRVDRKVYWGSVFKQLHTRGWINSSLSSFLADVTAISLVLFGTTGIILFWVPRVRRFKRVFARSS